MFLTRSEYEDLGDLLARLEDRGLSGWDRGFVEDMTARLRKYGRSLIVTAKQWEQLQRMQGKYL